MSKGYFNSRPSTGCIPLWKLHLFGDDGARGQALERRLDGCAASDVRLIKMIDKSALRTLMELQV